MARSLSRSLTRTFLFYSKSPSQQLSSSSLPLPYSSQILTHRHRSNKSGKAQLVEVDLESVDGGGGEIEVMGVRKLEDVIHNIIVRRSAPDWLPFLPGSSYWVPPRRRRGPAGVVEVLGKLAHPRSEEETLSFSSVRGWPSSAYFIEGSAPTRPVPVEVQVVEVKIQEDSDSESRSEDEEV